MIRTYFQYALYLSICITSNKAFKGPFKSNTFVYALVKICTHAFTDVIYMYILTHTYWNT